jgi:hypothetical protein
MLMFFYTYYICKKILTFLVEVGRKSFAHNVDPNSHLPYLFKIIKISQKIIDQNLTNSILPDFFYYHQHSPGGGPAGGVASSFAGG